MSERMVEYAPRGLVGVLTPQANTTVEPEFAILWPAGVAMINARLTSTGDTLEARLLDYFDTLGEAVRQFANAPIRAVAVACTGASYLAGAEAEDEVLRNLEATLGVPVVTAASAVVDALRALGARRIGLVSPYPPGLTEASARYWQARGFSVGAVASATTDPDTFHPIYSIPAAGARQALDRLAAERLDAVVMLGTGMPTLEPILDKPSAGGAPVMSCMLCLAWRVVEALDGLEPSGERLRAWIDGDGWRARFEARRWPPARA